MSKIKTYQQCKLRKGNLRMISWLPVRYAKVNKILKIKKEGVWQDGWIVLDKYWEEITEEKLKLVRDQCFNTRDVSDV